MRRLVVGDIHGCYDKLRDALDRAKFNPEKDMLYSLGDFCDRGKQNKEVLDYLVSLPHFKGVFGNHDIWLKLYINCLLDTGDMRRDIFSCWMNNGGASTVNDLISCDVPTLESYLDIIDNLFYRIELDDFILQHNVIPSWSLTENDTYRDFREVTLGNYKNKQFPLDEMYDVTIWDRFVDCLTILPTSISSQEFAKETSKTIVCGHTITKNILNLKDFNVIDIDTGSFVGVFLPAKECGWKEDGRITVLDLDSGEAYQSGVTEIQKLW